MRHAYLIIAHTNWQQLKMLISLLDAKENDIYIHIDKRAKEFNIEDFRGIEKLSKVKFYREYKVFWGSYSLVEVEIFLMEQACKCENNCYDYYHIISGMDLPLVSNKQINLFFELHRGKNFISFNNTKLCSDPEVIRRVKLFHFFQNYRRRYKLKVLNVFFTFIERVLLLLQIVFNVNRIRELDWVIKYGSNWVSITDELVKVILQQKQKIQEVFSYSNCADELFIQTIVYNFGFIDTVYVPESNQQSANLQLVDWKRGKNGNPYIFELSDYEMLQNTDNLFARKFSEKKDMKIIECICNEIKQKG